MDLIESVAGLEAVIGKAPAGMDLKVIDHLDAGARSWIAASPIMFANFASASAIGVSAAGGAPGAIATTSTQLKIPAAMIDEPGLACQGAAVGGMFLLPGISEILRVNGTVSSVSTSEIIVDVTECYGHCGKALIRSGFWSAEPRTSDPANLAAFAGASRFMALGTVDANGRADCSPKGDPAGALVHVEGEDVWFPDRPGNKRIDSFKNILTNPRVGALLIVPGAFHAARLTGSATMTTDDRHRRNFIVQDKVPTLVTRIANVSVEIYESATLARARLWPVTAPVTDIKPAKMFVDHVKLNKGLAAKLIGAAMSVPGLMQKGLEHDYKKNLY